MDLPRGVRLNNPGNIRIGLPWQGLTQNADPDFCAFEAPEWGIRAMCKILQHYQNEGVTTIREAINHWAPPSENDTNAYVDDVAHRCGIDPDTQITLSHYFPSLIPAIIAHEDADYVYDTATIMKGIAMAGP